MDIVSKVQKKLREDSTASREKTSSAVRTTDIVGAVQKNLRAKQTESPAQSNNLASWMNDVYKTSSRLGAEYKARDGKYQSAADYAAYRDANYAELDALLGKANEYRDYLRANEDGLDTATLKKMSDLARQYEGYINSAKSALDSEYNYWSQFVDERDYNNYIKMVEANEIEDGVRLKEERDAIVRQLERTGNADTKRLAELEEQIATLDLPSYNIAKGTYGAARKGVNQIAHFAASALAAGEDLLLSPFELLSGGELGAISDTAMMNKMRDEIVRQREDIDARFAANTAAGGKAAKAYEELMTATVAALPQALVGGAAAVPTSATLGATATASMSPSVANTVYNAASTMAKNPQYWLSFAQTVGVSYDQAIADMEASGEYDNNTIRTKAALQAIGSGLINAAIEIGGGIQTLPDELANGESAWNALVDSMVDEGREEVAQGIIERATQNLVYDKGNPLASLSDENAVFSVAGAAKEFASGAAVGGLLSGGQIAVNKIGNTIAERSYKNGVVRALDEATTMARLREIAEGMQTGEQTGSAETTQNDTTVDSVKKIMGEEGANIFAEGYNSSAEDEQRVSYRQNMIEAYAMGRGGKTLAEGKFYKDENGNAAGVTSEQLQRIYEAGLKERATATASSVTRKAAVYKADAGIDYSDAVTSEYVKGSVDKKTESTINAVAKALGVKVRFAEYGTVGGGKANAEIENGIVTIEKNNENPLRFLFGHEITHRMQELAGAEYDRLRAAIETRSGIAERVLIAQNAAAKHGDTLSYTEALDEVVADEIGLLLEDSGEMERFIRKHSDDRTMLEKLRDVVRTIRRKLGNSPEAKRFRETEKLLSAALDKSVETVRKSEQTAEKNTAESGGVKQSIKENFKLQIDKWDRETTGFSFVVGETSEALQIAKVPKKQIRMDSSKIKALLEKHGGMTAEIIKEIPELLENPIVVIDSKKDDNSRIVMGDLYDANGKMVTVVLLLTPTSRKGNVLDIIKISSAEGRGHIQSLFYKDDKSPVTVRYVDKKRIHSWLYANRLQLPLRNLGLDSNDKVSQPEPKVKGKFSYKDYTAQEKQEHNNTALEHFGKTYRWSETGYLLLNGEKLDFSGKHDGAPGGYRTVDHRDIKEALGLDYGGEDYSGAMVQFMGEGNIRISPENNGINLSVAPTDAQERALEDYISRVRGEVIVDLDDLNGNTLESIEYPRGTRASKVLSDIRNYFAEGVVPQVSEVAKYRYSRKDASGLTQEIARIQREGKELGHSNAEIQAEIRAAVEEAYSGMVDEYGAMEAGENPYRESNVPKRTAKKEKVSQTVRTIVEAEATPEVMLPAIEQLVAEGTFSYNTYTDEKAIADAERTIVGKSGLGWAKAYAEWSKAMDKGEVSKANTAMGWVLYNNAANSGDVQTAIDTLDKMVEHQRNAAQALQATRILKKLSPDAQLYGAQRSVANLKRELKEKYGDKAPDLKIDTELAEKFLRARTDEGRAAAMRDIYRDIGRQMPSRFIDKWNAWRYLAMLGNARTHVRNIVGNAFFAPVVAAKNLTATGIEAAVSRVSGGKIQRNKAFVGTSKTDRAILSAAWKDYANVQESMGEGKYSDFANANKHIEEGRRIFKFKPLEAARRGNSAALEAEDAWFSHPHYASALAQYCKAHGITASMIENGRGIKEARAYAMLEAQKATYRDTNALSQTISGLGRYQGKNPVARGISTVMEGILPFRKTPANILARGIEYSPLGLMNGVKQALYDVKKGNKTAAEAIDSISAGLTGTGLLALGIWLASEGIIRGHGGGDEKEKEFEEMMGHQAYSLEVGSTSVTLDWLAPECLPFFVGVNLWEQTRGENEEVTLSSMLAAITTVTEPLLEMSCLQSLNDVFDSVGYATSNGLEGLPTALTNAATSYLMQGLPTVLGQAERSGESYRMTTYTEKNAFLTNDMQYALGKASARIPGWEYQQIPYIDAWGQKEQSGNVFARSFDNFLNPAYTSKIDTSAMEEELLRLYDATGESSVFPKRAEKYFTVAGERKDLTAEEYVKYATALGTRSYEIITALTKSKQYKAMSDEEKVRAISNAYSFAKQEAKAKVSAYKPESWVANAKEAKAKHGINVATFAALRAATTGIENMRDENGDAIENSGALLKMKIVYDMPGLTDEQRKAMFVYLGVGKSVRNLSEKSVAKKLEQMRKRAE